VKGPAQEDEHAIRTSEGMNVGPIKRNDVLPLIENNLTIEEVAEKLDISEEAACAMVVASLRSSRARRSQQPHSPFPQAFDTRSFRGRVASGS
jgi:hypothetical protein